MLAPFWPLIRGIVQAFRATPVEVPFYDRVDSPQAAVAAVRERITGKSVALYVSTPSNPTGRVLPAAWLEALAELARSEGLWLISDEVYEDYVYRGAHVSIARFAPERTLTAFSFSKAYGMAGHRTGYLVGPPAAVSQALKVSTHTFYAAPTAGQQAGLRALEAGAAWVARAREAYREVGERVAAELGIPAPEGGAFLFVDVSPQARRARHLGLPRGLPRRWRRARAGALLRRGLHRLGAPVLHGGRPGRRARRCAQAREAAALALAFARLRRAWRASRGQN